MSTQSQVLASTFGLYGTTNIEYRDIPGFPGYRVGLDASVWSSWKRAGNYGLTPRWIISSEWKRLTTKVDGKGYLCYTLYGKGSRSIRKRKPVHQLLLLAFVGECPEGMSLGRHLDGNRLNNSLDNITWGTAFENYWDQERHGTRNPPKGGEKHPSSKFKSAEIRAMYALRGQGLSGADIAKRFDTSSSYLSQVFSGNTWPELHKELGHTIPKARMRRWHKRPIDNSRNA